MMPVAVQSLARIEFGEGFLRESVEVSAEDRVDYVLIGLHVILQSYRADCAEGNRRRFHCRLLKEARRGPLVRAHLAQT